MHNFGGECQAFIAEDKRKREIEQEKLKREEIEKKKREEERKRKEEETIRKKQQERESVYNQNFELDDDDWAVDDPSPKVQGYSHNSKPVTGGRPADPIKHPNTGITSKPANNGIYD